MRQFGTSAKVSARHFGTGAELSRHFGTSWMMPKCLGSEVSWVRSDLTPYSEGLLFRKSFIQISVMVMVRVRNSVCSE